MLARETFLRQIGALGIRRGDVLLVHSSLRALGPVEGGAEMILDALLEVLGPEGTLMMPGFQSGSEYMLASRNVCFDVRNTPSDCGYLTEVFRRYPGAARSLSPTHSMTVFGPRGDELIRGHERCEVTAGYGSPFERLIALDGRILMLGAPRRSNTTMHYLENTGGAPTVCALRFPTSVIDAGGRVISTPIYPHMPGLSRNYEAAIDLLEKAGGVTSGPVGEARCECYRARLLAETVRAALRKNPCAFIRIFTPGRNAGRA